MICSSGVCGKDGEISSCESGLRVCDWDLGWESAKDGGRLKVGIVGN